MTSTDLLVTVGMVVALLLAVAIAAGSYYAARILRLLEKISQPPKYLLKRPKRRVKHKKAEQIVSGGPKVRLNRKPYSGMDEFDTGESQIVGTKTPDQILGESEAAKEARLDKWMPGVKRNAR